MTTWPTSPIDPLPPATSLALSDPYPRLTPIGPLDTIRGNVGSSADVSNPPPENRVEIFADKRTETLRNVVNELLDLANSLLDTFVSRDGSSLRGNLSMGGNPIISMPDAVLPYDLATHGQLDSLRFDVEDLQQQGEQNTLLRDGTHPMAGNLNLGGRRITSSAPAVSGIGALHGMTKLQYDTVIDAIKTGLVDVLGNHAIIGDISFDGGVTAVVRYHGIAGLPVPVASDEIATKAYAEAKAASISPQLLPTGIIAAYGGPVGFLPARWLICNGQEVLKTTYSTLYTIIQDYYGTPTAGTRFKLPDFRGRVPVGSANGFTPSGADPRIYIQIGRAHV